MKTSNSQDSQQLSTDRVNTPAVVALCLAATMVTLDLSLINTALPTIASALGVTAAKTIWLITAYQIAVIALLLPFASLGEIVGHKRVFFHGLILFTASSLISGVSTDLTLLIIARCFQGIGGAAVSSVVTALIKSCYPTKQLGKGMGIYALVVGLSFTAGPTVAACILALSNWHVLFLFSLPIGIYCLYLTNKHIPTTPSSKRPFDTLGGMLCMLVFGLAILGLVTFAHEGFVPKAAYEIGTAAICLVILIHHQKNDDSPMLATDLFKSTQFAFSSLTSIFAFMTQGVAFIALPFLFHDFLAASPMMTGLYITPWPAVVALMALFSGALSDRMDPDRLCTLGVFILAAGMLTLCFLPEKSGIVEITWRMMVCGVGFGLFQAPNLKAMISKAPSHRSGSASAIVALSRLTGQSLGAASVALAFHISPEKAPQLALWLGVAFAIIGTFFSGLRTIKNKQ